MSDDRLDDLTVNILTAGGLIIRLNNQNQTKNYTK